MCIFLLLLIFDKKRRKLHAITFTSCLLLQLTVGFALFSLFDVTTRDPKIINEYYELCSSEKPIDELKPVIGASGGILDSYWTTIKYEYENEVPESLVKELHEQNGSTYQKPPSAPEWFPNSATGLEYFKKVVNDSGSQPLSYSKHLLLNRSEKVFYYHYEGGD